MKSLLFALLILASCSTPARVWIGMSQKDLVSQRIPNLTIAEMTPTRTVYASCNYYADACVYFYFHDGRLTSMDRGIQPADISIEVK